jgi:aspartyl-tRNA(Asn)/glutamyl-tRNA(Gln) amidotransferase subunit C
VPQGTIDRKLVLHVAKLASVSLAESEVDRLAEELARIVGYFEQLDQADTRDIPPTAHVQLDRMALRDDELIACLPHAEALAAAPQVDGDGFAVPTFVE